MISVVSTRGFCCLRDTNNQTTPSKNHLSVFAHSQLVALNLNRDSYISYHTRSSTKTCFLLAVSAQHTHYKRLHPTMFEHFALEPSVGRARWTSLCPYSLPMRPRVQAHAYACEDLQLNVVGGLRCVPKQRSRRAGANSKAAKTYFRYEKVCEANKHCV